MKAEIKLTIDQTKHLLELEENVITRCADIQVLMSDRNTTTMSHIKNPSIFGRIFKSAWVNMPSIDKITELTKTYKISEFVELHQQWFDSKVLLHETPLLTILLDIVMLLENNPESITVTPVESDAISDLLKIKIGVLN